MTTRMGMSGYPPSTLVQPVVKLVGVLADQERILYESIWSGVPTYRNHSPGEQLVSRFLEMSGATQGTVLDAGCGSGKASVLLSQQGFNVTLADVTDAGLVSEAQSLPFVSVVLWSDLRPVAYAGTRSDQFDYVYCCDVLEHIPTEFTMLVLTRLLEVTRTGLFLSISTVPDVFGRWVGKSLHQTIKDFVWWRDHLREFAEIIECRDLLNSALFYVRPR